MEGFSESDEDLALIWDQLLDEDVDEYMVDLLLNTDDFYRPSKRQKGPNIDRDFVSGHNRIFQDYFAPNPVYSEDHFRRRFRMPSSLMKQIIEKVSLHDPFFQRRPNCTGKFGASPLQKITAAIRQMAYGTSADATDEYCRISDTLARISLKRFAKAVNDIYGKEFLRPPNEEEIDKLMKMNEKRGFPGMLGSLDVMHLTWKNCPKALAGMYKGKEMKPTICLEAVGSGDLYIWFMFFGMPGSCNDINVIDRSPFVESVINGDIPCPPWKLGDTERKWCYVLTDGIYPSYKIFVKTINAPVGPKQQLFAHIQEEMELSGDSISPLVHG